MSGELKYYWDRKKEYQAEQIALGKVLMKHVPSPSGGKVHVVAPVNGDFYIEAIKLGGRFRHRSGMWTFPFKLIRPIYGVCMRIYGQGSVIYTGPDFRKEAETL